MSGIVMEWLKCGAKLLQHGTTLLDSESIVKSDNRNKTPPLNPNMFMMLEQCV